MKPRISIVIPCYNEAQGLKKLVTRCEEVAAQHPIEFILVDNGSKDETSVLLPNLVLGLTNLRSIRVEVNQGYGFGILSGLKVAEGEYLGWTHADLQTDPGDVLTALQILAAHPNESLFIKGRRHGRPLADIFFTVGMSLLETIVLRTPLWDINAQPNIFPRTFFESWKEAPHDFSLDLCGYYRARRAGLRVKRFPVLFAKREFGTSHWNINWRMKWKFIKRTLDYTWQLRAHLS